MTWRGEPEPQPGRVGFWGMSRILLRGVPLGLLLFGGLIVLLAVRLVEKPLFSDRRPVTSWIPRFVCRVSLVLMGFQLTVQGKPMILKGAVVGNHGSWLDIFSLNACQRGYFVSKSEVANWPGIGWLARAVGTVFIRRDRSDAIKQKTVFEDRLNAGHKLLFFPEGTSSDGRRVLPFKSTLFAAFFANKLREEMFIQPATVTYHAPTDQPSNFYGWWGDMDFAPHMLQMLAARQQGRIELFFHAPLKVADYPNRKALALDCENAVRSGLMIKEPSTF